MNEIKIENKNGKIIRTALSILGHLQSMIRYQKFKSGLEGSNQVDLIYQNPNAV
jgi:hypothetical protein